MKVNLLIDEGEQIIEIKTDIIPRLKDLMLVKETKYYSEDDPLGSYLTVTQVLHNVENGEIVSIDVWLNAL